MGLTCCKIYRLILLLFLSLVALSINSQECANESVLAKHSWYKIPIVEKGFYRITYSDLEELGIDMQNVNPQKISVFGNVNGILPESNKIHNYDDLTEMNIIVSGEDDGAFDEEDHIIFYAQDQVKWDLRENDFFYHNTNYYSDTSYYFLRIDGESNGKRILNNEVLDIVSDNIIDRFVDYKCHEIDLNNHYYQGRRWYGETVSLSTVPELRYSFVFPNIVETEYAYIRANLVGASSSESFCGTIRVNEDMLFDTIRINKAGPYLFGAEINKVSYFNSEKDTINVDVSIIANNSASLIGVDFIEINAWRYLKYNNEELYFNILPKQMNASGNKIVIDNAVDDLELFDITDPLNVYRCVFNIDDDDISYEFVSDNFKSFVLTNDDYYRDIIDIRPIKNQNLHSLSSAEMLIISHPLFMEEAEQISRIHEEYDALNTVVVNVNEIYNEFSSGAVDVTAIRNFIRMVYDRDNSLKYVLLMGRGTCDYKNILKMNNNFIPPYESIVTYSEINSYVTDDYFALLDNDEGQDCYGTVDIGIGRIPVSTKTEAQGVVEKIIRYIRNDVDNFDDWRTKILFIADDDVVEYARNNDALERIIDSSYVGADVEKIYLDSYIRVPVSGGYSYPDATSDLLSKINEGLLMMSYTGHGGVKGLTEEGLLQENHIVALENKMLPFMLTATCEFSKFDDPTYISAGEKLFTNIKGGTIGMLTSTRPTMIGNNFIVSKNMYLSLFDNDDINNITFGDIIRETKRKCADNSSGYLCYVMFGDPALRLRYPNNTMMINEINDTSLDTEINLSAMSDVIAKGIVLNADGEKDDLFNGILHVKMYDSESNFKMLNNNGVSNMTYNFSFYKDVIYEGLASVRKGEFCFSYKIPQSLNYQGNNARISLYAFDTIRYIDATYRFDHIEIDGVAAGVAPDLDGPHIEMIWNQNTINSGVINMNFYDTQGILHYDNQIGRDIILYHKSPEGNKSINLNSFFKPMIDDFSRGTISFDCDKLTAGRHVFTVRAWDSHNNSSEKSIVVNISDDNNDPILYNVYNQPNPFTNETEFCFNFSKENVTYDVIISIYDVMGRKINELKYENLFDNEVRIKWDGCDMSGYNLSPGLYLYRLVVVDSNGDKYEMSQRMMRF